MRYLKNKLRELFVKRETLVFIILTLIILLCGAFNRDFIRINNLLGILVSSLTESPIISGILTFAFVSATTWMPEFVSSLESFSLINKFITFLYGQIDITAIILFVTFTILCILITMIIMQRRKSIK